MPAAISLKVEKALQEGGHEAVELMTVEAADPAFEDALQPSHVVRQRPIGTLPSDHDQGDVYAVLVHREVERVRQVIGDKEWHPRSTAHGLPS